MCQKKHREDSTRKIILWSFGDKREERELKKGIDASIAFFSMGSEKDSTVDQIDFWEKILYKILYDVSENGFQKKSKEKKEP